MSRYAASQNIASAVCNSVLQKEATYREPITENMALTVAAATASADLEETLQSIQEYIDDESIFSNTQVQEFLQERRGKLKQIAASNVNNQRQVDVFLDSVRALKQVEEQNFDQAAETTDEADKNDPGQRLGVIYQQKVQSQSSMQIEIHQEKHYRKVCETLGDTDDTTLEDNDIAIVHQSGTQSTLNCPITTVLLEEPVKNKACGHVYSHAAILNMIHQQRRGSCKCPVVGCPNHKVVEAQLEKDLVTEQILKRERRKQDQEKEMRLSQADAVEDSEEE